MYRYWYRLAQALHLLLRIMPLNIRFGFISFVLFLLISCDNVFNRDAEVKYFGKPLGASDQGLLCPAPSLLTRSDEHYRLVTSQEVVLEANDYLVLEQVVAIQSESFWLSFLDQGEMLGVDKLEGLKLFVCEQEASLGTKAKTVSLTQTVELTGFKNKPLLIILVNDSESKLAFELDVSYSLSESEPGIVLDKVQGQEPVTGFLDLHLHQTGAMAFNHGWYWGSHEKGSLAEHLPACRGEHGSMFEYESLLDNSITGPIAYAIAPKRDVDDFMRSHRNLTQAKDYVRSNERKHQQVAYERLKQAHERGLNLIISTVVENNVLLDIMYAMDKGKDDWYPSVMESIHRQVMSLKKIDDQSEWFEIVYDPWHARRAINQGKLAVVLGAEFTDIFPLSDGPWKQQLYDLYFLGLRHLQPVHKSDSQFSSTHDQGFPFDNTNLLRAFIRKEIPNWPALQRTFGQSDPAIGLSEAGFELLDEMVKLNMIVDLSHASLASQREMTDHLLLNHNYYPFIYSHWKARSPELLDKLKQAGGMIPLGWGQPVPESKEAMLEGNELSCQDFVKKRAELYQRYLEYGVNFSLSSDMNGFTSTTQPNFGPLACELDSSFKGREDQEATWKKLAEVYPNHPDWIRRYWAQGTADVSLLPGIIYDLREVRGIDTSAIDHSTETFIKMWERSYDPNRVEIQ